MPKRIPISAVKSIGQQYDCPQVILLAWDGELTHIVTWGKTLEDCSQAAEGGNRLKEKWGWPESNDQPSRVRKLELAMQELINCGEKLRLNLHDAATLYPEKFHSEAIFQILNKWTEALGVARSLQRAATPEPHKAEKVENPQ